jgi:uncharacterized paraquat-inducible protein A
LGWVLGGLLTLPLLILHLWALADVLRTPLGVWAAAEQNQFLWALVVLLLVLVGPVLYLVIVRPQLISAASQPR